MSEVVGEAVVVIRTDESGVDYDGAGSKGAKGYKRGFGSGLKGLGAMIGGALAVGAGLSFAKTGARDARAYAKAYAATEQIIKATGGSANVTAEQIGEMTAALEAKTAVDDEVIQRGANLLLTFKNVRNEVGRGNDMFNRANQAALDLSAAGFGAVEGQAKMLGKALNDPVKGISALSRSGVTFTADQEKVIKSLAESGDVLAAQKIIMQEVESQVGGTAAAQVTAADKAGVAWDNLRQQFGELLLPAIDAAASAFTTYLAPALFSALDAAEGIGPAVSRIAGDLSGLFSTAAGSGPVTALFATLRDAATTVLPILAQTFATVRPIVVSLFDSLREAAASILPVMAETFTGTVLPAVIAFGAYVATSLWPVLKEAAAIVINQVVPAIVSLATYIYGTVYPALVGLVTVVASQVKPVFDAFIQVLLTRVLPTISRLIEQVRTQLVPALQPVIQRVIQVSTFLIGLAAAILGKVLPPVLKFAGFLLQHLVPAVVGVITVVVQIIGGILDLGAAIVSGVKWLNSLGATMNRLAREGLQKVVDGVRDLPNKIRALGPLLRAAAGHLMEKFVDGLKGAGGLISDIAGNVWDTVKGLLNDAIDRINAALEFEISIPGPNIHINPPNIPALAKGTDYFGGGVALVGEEGPELAVLPRGSSVTPARETADILAGRGDGGGNVYIGTMMPHNYNEFDRQIRERRRLASLGGRPVR